LPSGVCLQHDAAQPLTAPHSMKLIQDLTVEVLPHSQYSPDLAPQRFSPLLGPQNTPCVEVTSDHVGWWWRRCI